MDITFRPAEFEDLDTAAQIVQSAYNDLRTRHGLAPTVPLRPPLFQSFCLAENPEGMWIAETSGTPVGFGFAWVRQRIGVAEEEVSPPAEVRDVAGLVAWLAARSPGHASAFANARSIRAAVNQEFATPEQPVKPGDEIAFFPPVTGG